MRNRIPVAAFAFLTAVALSSGAGAEDWQVRRNKETVTCSVQPANRKPLEGNLVSVHANRVAACKDALARNTNEVANAKGCIVYAPGTMAECRKDGVFLPK